ncbi:MAG: response regulator transcription factor [Acidimicrobiia bacterium]|nr:MAG: response regulator transcription factor [Acidimicrobiia bacterium]
MNPTSVAIRILIVDDHKVVRNGLRTFFSVHDDLELVGEARNGQEAVDKCATVRPDVVLMDMKMPVMDGPEAIERILAHSSDIRIIALTSFDDETFARRALEAGAIGYLFKDVEEDDLVSAIRLASQGKGVVAPEAMQALVRTTIDADEYAVVLTDRELETLGFVARGLTNPQIADRLMVSVSTVNFHVHNVLDKLGAKTRTEAVMIAAREGLIEV